MPGKMFKSDPTKTEPWKGIMLRNAPGKQNRSAALAKWRQLVA
jgi:hypothetical protein